MSPTPDPRFFTNVDVDHLPRFVDMATTVERAFTPLSPAQSVNDVTCSKPSVTKRELVREAPRNVSLTINNLTDGRI